MGLSEWNEALVKAVFLDAERAGTNVCRMDATGQLLEKISGITGQEAAKRQFISAFGNDAAKIRQLYRQTSISLTPATSVPPSFAALYLTLLAGSGDDSTSDEGLFRRRFAAMLKMEELASIDFVELPRMWQEFARWCERRANVVGDCLRLILPDPRNESRIGYSKRLAFPTFSDEKCLRQLVGETGISSSSAFQSVDHAIFSRLNDFSSAFREEALIFHELVSAGRNEEAFDSPLWGALRDIGFALEKKSRDLSGRFCIELDMADPLFPELAVLVDERGARAAGLAGATKLQRPRPPYMCVWRADGLDVSIKPLVSLGRKDRNFAQLWMWRGLNAGCLPLFPDQFGGLSSDGEYYDEGPVALLSLQPQVAIIKDMAHHLGLNIRVPAHGDGKWSVVLISSIRRASLERLSLEMPASIRLLLQPAWKPARLSVADAARYGDAILLSPASSPEVRLRGATGGSYELVGTDGRPIGAGKLEGYGEGFRIPPIDLAELATTAVCRYQVDAVPSGAAADFSVLPAAPVVPPKAFPDPEAWICDAAGAKLGSLELARPEACVKRGSPESLFDRESGPDLFPPVSNAKEERARAAFLWLGEVLLTRFQQRATLPLEEVNARVASASQAAGLQAWMIQRALFASGWLVHVQRRTAPFQVAALGDRVLVSAPVSEGVRVRLCGLVGENELVRLRQLLQDGESCVPTDSQPRQLSIGTWTIHLVNASRVSAIADALGFRLRQKAAGMPCPLASELQQALRGELETIKSPSAETFAWDGSRSCWSDDRTIFQEASFFCTRGNQRNKYWGAHGTGAFQTDSFAWALLLARQGAGAPLGFLADDGSLKWYPGFPSIPTPLSNWWMQDGGGSVGIGSDGAVLFLGGGGLGQWNGHFGLQVSHSLGMRDGASDRRDLALGIRRKLWKRYQAV